jgi:hypothetical protein
VVRIRHHDTSSDLGGQHRDEGHEAASSRMGRTKVSEQLDCAIGYLPSCAMGAKRGSAYV